MRSKSTGLASGPRMGGAAGGSGAVAVGWFIVATGAAVGGGTSGEHATSRRRTASKRLTRLVMGRPSCPPGARSQGAAPQGVVVGGAGGYADPRWTRPPHELAGRDDEGPPRRGPSPCTTSPSSCATSTGRRPSTRACSACAVGAALGRRRRRAAVDLARRSGAAPSSPSERAEGGPPARSEAPPGGTASRSASRDTSARATAPASRAAGFPDRAGEPVHALRA